MFVALSPELQAFVRSQVEGGRFNDEASVIEAALRQFRDRAERRAAVCQMMVEESLLEAINA